MTETMFLTGHEETRYIELLKPLADKRISDMKKLMTQLRIEVRTIPMSESEHNKKVLRYQKVEQAIKWWEELLNKGNIEHE